MAEVLTPQQRQAVENRGGRLLVSAAAGSGKTKVLVDRVMSYVMDEKDPANIDDFLLITFTKAAAAELRGKIAAKLTERIAENPENRHLQQQLQRLYLAKISTVHSFCGDILREYAYKLDIPGDFRVGDENECAELRFAVVDQVLNRAYDTASENPDFRAFMDSQGLGRNDSQVPKLILQVHENAKCHMNPKQWLSQCIEQLSVSQAGDVSETVFGRYLIERFHRWLDLQLDALGQCVNLASKADRFENVTALLLDTVYQLTSLRNCGTWDAIVQHKKLEFGTLTFPKKSVDVTIVERIKAVRNSCKDNLPKQLKLFANSSGQVLADLQSCLESARGLVNLVESFDKEYEKAKRIRRILDFSDLEHCMLDLLMGKSRSGVTALADEIGSRFREIMVDEYQDSSEVQDAIYYALSRKRLDLFMVGDVKQAIYQFRLADPDIFLKKYMEFTPADQASPGQDRKVVLSKNFRSGGGVLAAANDVFKTCMNPEVGGLHYGKDEALYEGIDHISLGSPEAELYCIDAQEDTYAEEAAFVADKIRRMLQEGTPVRTKEGLRPVRAEDIVVLLRSPNTAGGYYRRALERAGIRCVSGGVNLLQTEEIGDLRCLLQAVHNPRLDIPLLGAMASPVFGFTADELAAIRSGNKQCSMFESLQQSQNEKCRRFLEDLQQLRYAMRQHSLTGLLEEILFRTSMDDVYAAMDNGQERRENLQTFFQLAADYEGCGNHDLGRFLEYLDNMEKKGLITDAAQGTSDAVTIMSVHKSKGLEFPVVFLCCLGRTFNTESQRASILCHKKLGLGLSVANQLQRVRYPSIAKRAIAAQIGAESISEEMRVLYVAMTRPKDRIIMTYASSRLQKDLQEMVSRMGIGNNELLIREASCPGEWILLAALRRTEAGELFALGGYPENISPGKHPWNIRIVTAPEQTEAASQVENKGTLPAHLLQRAEQGLAFRYDHAAAVQAPSKQTATQRKGRQKDQEVAEHTEKGQQPVKLWRKPCFLEQQHQGREFGTAIHAVMQYIDYRSCTDEAGVRQEVERLVAQRYITEEQGAMADCEKIATFFTTEIGKKLCSGADCVREFKFSILEDGLCYDPALQDEQVLLQGVVDCALIEEDGITVVDFKTDFVTEETLPAAVERYRPQVETYAGAMERIYQKPVKKAFLYFFRLNRFEQV